MCRPRSLHGARRIGDAAYGETFDLGQNLSLLIEDGGIEGLHFAAALIFLPGCGRGYTGAREKCDTRSSCGRRSAGRDRRNDRNPPSDRARHRSPCRAALDAGAAWRHRPRILHRARFPPGPRLCRDRSRRSERQRGPNANWRSCRVRFCSSKRISRSLQRAAMAARSTLAAGCERLGAMTPVQCSAHWPLCAKTEKWNAPFVASAPCSRRSCTRTSFDSSGENINGARKKTLRNSMAPCSDPWVKAPATISRWPVPGMSAMPFLNRCSERTQRRCCENRSA